MKFIKVYKGESERLPQALYAYILGMDKKAISLSLEDSDMSEIVSFCGRASGYGYKEDLLDAFREDMIETRVLHEYANFTKNRMQYIKVYSRQFRDFASDCPFRETEVKISSLEDIKNLYKMVQEDMSLKMSGYTNYYLVDGDYYISVGNYLSGMNFRFGFLKAKEKALKGYSYRE